ncbi:hypothetical protein BN1058_01636 [Paraliobacillus sp. PM-2]|uniref:hypothetical protein n=1 Tax=Paraliobacillus sp. PM-2 TaxID=1462524 RepID=UPI00061C9316|nr:hypothetical protein [Paraliobacillus sp. PM-2]CQR47327.1 hypothetical protein BN1058_01636 [Paraliobacillus sp. PM-2]
MKHITFVAVDNDIIVGFGDIDKKGYKVIKKQVVNRQSVLLTNYFMKKQIE